MDESTSHTLRRPENEDEWRAYHAIRRKVLFENRGRFGVYDENYPDEFEKDNYPLILFDRDTPIGVIRVDIDGRVAWFRRVAVREDLQRTGHGRVLLSLAEAFAREAGCNEACSNVAADAVGFYERCGYSRDLSTPADSVDIPMHFDAYRQFYRRPTDLALAKKFLLERFQHSESTIFLAIDEGGTALGFVQLFPSFSSGAAARILILNDLYVAPEARRAGIGRLLLRAAADYGKAIGAIRLTLSTEVTNTSAQALYESEGWKLQTDFCVYNLALTT